MRLIQPPDPLQVEPNEPVVFLAGSIDMGNTTDWQADLIRSLEDCHCLVLNPRRKNWDSTWPSDASFTPFREQVQWELAAMEKAGLIAFYFSPTSKTPITLLELGLAARSGKAVVCCPSGYWRKGNVDVVCDQYGISVVPTLPDLVNSIRNYCKNSKKSVATQESKC